MDITSSHATSYRDTASKARRELAAAGHPRAGGNTIGRDSHGNLTFRAAASARKERALRGRAPLPATPTAGARAKGRWTSRC